MAEWCQVQSSLQRVTLDFFERWPDAWTVYCGRGDKHPKWPDLDLGQKLHVVFYYQDDLVGDVREIDGQQFVGDRIALEHLLSHVRLHVACGPGCRRRCACCDPNSTMPGAVDYREAKAVTAPEVLDRLAERIARAKEVSGIGMIVRQMYARPRIEPEPVVA